MGRKLHFPPHESFRHAHLHFIPAAHLSTTKINFSPLQKINENAGVLQGRPSSTSTPTSVGRFSIAALLQSISYSPSRTEFDTHTGVCALRECNIIGKIRLRYHWPLIFYMYTSTCIHLILDHTNRRRSLRTHHYMPDARAAGGILPIVCGTRTGSLGALGMISFRVRYAAYDSSS
jgi:hypothetical protein